MTARLFDDVILVCFGSVFCAISCMMRSLNLFASYKLNPALLTFSVSRRISLITNFSLSIIVNFSPNYCFNSKNYLKNVSEQPSSRYKKPIPRVWILQQNCQA